LKQRCVRTIEVVVSDGSGGLIKALAGLYPRVAHQQCVFHKEMNLADHLEMPRHRHRIITDARHVFEATAATETAVEKRQGQFVGHWSSR
jgi:transposase-like protein